MNKTAIIYGSTTDNTKSAAEIIKQKIGGDVALIDVSNLKVEELNNYQNLIFGTSTWGLGDLQDDWDSFLPKLAGVDLKGKTIALFGLGDSGSYSDTYVDGMGILYEAIAGTGANLIGKVAVDGYDFDESRAVVGGEFVGLALDEENDGDKTEERISDWVDKIKSFL
ncbi:flavodoxin [Bacteroidales bacterium OttesenSCG-928-M11]|nr:flavodoxin [Bacteroidales bacterium OttesenSCG-928-M11]